MQKALKILKRHWGYLEFRPQQLPVIEALVAKKDVIALLPTGGGKSVCFQIPALLQEGICIVVSPLIALMKDQVNALQQKNIKAMALTGGMRYDDVDKQLDNCIYGNYKFLYLSPERLQQDLVQQRIKQMNVNLVAIDEAHCISQWGHDFRPAYRNISLLRELKPEAPFAALTATATTEVIQDMKAELQIPNAIVIKRSFERSNIAYNVLNAEDKYYRLLQLLKKKNESVIIYVRSRNATMETTTFLRKNSHSAEAFHGGLKNEEKALRLEKWLNNDFNIMVATTAFGMGIDKPDVRQVIHLNLPESLESYFQEAGRAGRDEKPAVATIVTNPGDIPVLKNQFLINLPKVEDVKLVYKKLNSYFRIAYGEGENENHDFNFSEFCTQYELNSIKTFNAMQMLDRCSIIRLSQQFQRKTELQFIVSDKQLSYYLRDNSTSDKLVKAILRTYGGIFENKISINLGAVCKKAGLAEEETIDILKKLGRDQIIDFAYFQNDASVNFLVPREDDITINPVAAFIKLHHQNKKQKIEAVIEYVNKNDVCRNLQLLNYFGEKPKIPCGICSVCSVKNSRLNKEQMNEIYKEIAALLKKRELTSRELVENITFPEQHILKVLQLLTEKRIIDRIESNRFKLIKNERY
ncbi:RecQ family ATP-dependent DNA helicase [Autumnicola musiva]|uniref:ATP-dependent DNA helicase RecQ n=1 Tax=Autumnicola musiva TaxID=3075589 RepID=A0ABU3D5L0_9FLAO|nr:RecQ family ATP-dependent DNA helicase [Zunongwangia sp. F117]MDT0676822.1 RecQ family ATP-dependent DNA helicase [Zunongwangia sp. F117]